jgi:N-dimethylarginine dimethylaminohydrolase
VILEVGYKMTRSDIIINLQGYSFPVTKLNALLLTLFERYAQLLRDRFSKDFQKAFRETQHQPMEVVDADELQKVLNVCWLKPGDAERLKSLPFPLALPFSQTYPLCCIDIRNLTDQYYQFSDGFSQSHRDVDDILKKSLDELLIQQVSNSIRSSLQRTSNLSQIAQIVVNAEHFRLACTQLETLLAALRAPHRGGKLRLDASSHFNTTLDMAQQRIDSAIAAKMLEFFGMAEYSWVPTQQRTEPQEWIPEMLQWLSTMMESVLVALPRDIKMEHYKTAFQYVADTLLNDELLNKDDPQASLLGLVNAQIDVDYLIKQSDAMQEGMSDVFQELKQTMSIPIEGKVSEYAMNTTTRLQKYKDVKPVKMAALLEKLGKYEGRPGSGERGEREAAKRKNEREAVLRLVRR